MLKLSRRSRNGCETLGRRTILSENYLEILVSCREGKKVKRVASYQLEAERERVRRMKGKWSNIINLTQGVRKMFDIYFQNYGELAAPPEIVYDPSLDE